MKYTIFQMPVSLWHANNIIFDQNSKVRFIDYLPVYHSCISDYSKTDLEICDELFEEFNIRHPQDYVSRSLSSGDVIAIRRGDVNNMKYYLCCSFGWHELVDFK